jgi:outer membrane protein OmpA-like peptidoglycan-associated protein
LEIGISTTINIDQSYLFVLEPFLAGSKKGEITMGTIRRIASALTVVVIVMSAAWQAVAADGAPSAAITMSHDSGGIGIGWHTGDGKLALNDGSEYAFTVDAYSILGFGFANVTSTGKVYNLEKASDLSGEYTGTGATATFGQGEGTSSLKNAASGVRIELTSKETGVRAGIGVGSVTFKLGKMLKGPRKPKRVVQAPVRMVKTTLAPKPVVDNPTEYTLEFGFNKSRVNLALGRTLDKILADWKGKAAGFRIVGHADAVGSEKYNRILSQKRADAVKNALVRRGLPASRISALGVGQKDLAVKTKRGQRLRENRRVQLIIIKKKY